MRICEACGKPLKGGIYIGGVLLDRQCASDVEAEIARLREEGKPVNAMHIARSMFRETYSAGNYLLRDIPEVLWIRAKHRAVDDGDTIRDLLLKALYSYLQ